jgi:hypothetical protein
MSDLMECNISGGKWLVGELIISREEFETMVPDYRGEYSAVIRNNGYLYYYDQLVPRYDFSNGIPKAKVNFQLTPKNFVQKIPE